MWRRLSLLLCLLPMPLVAADGPAQPATAAAPDAAARAAARADQRLVKAIRRHAQPIVGAPGDYDALLARLQTKRFVLLGEDTHGTDETYRERARITLRLIEELGFDGLVVESDFTALERANAYVLGESADPDAYAALDDHQRFPRWMWVNRPFAQLIEALREHNRRESRTAQVFGMDLHGMAAAAGALRQILQLRAATLGASVDEDLDCLARHEFSPERYRAVINEKGLTASCEAPTARAVARLEQFLSTNEASTWPRAAVFSLSRNAALVAASEAYSRLQIDSGAAAWNHRDRYLAAAAAAIAQHLEARSGRPAKLVLWAHNTHMADARATDRGQRSAYVSLGQVLREAFPEDTYIVGFTTRLGTVRAAANWGETDRAMTLRRPAWESLPAIFGRVRRPAFWLPFDAPDPDLAALDQNLALRAIGVVYWPHAERREHYFRGDVREMFDAVVHIDRSQALIVNKHTTH